jgi:nicotinate-nucleotide pyrophosphorylase (carboxylating)
MPAIGLPPIVIDPLIAAALAEDFGQQGDITSQAIIPPARRAKAIMKARKGGVLAGIGVAARSFTLFEPAAQVEIEVQDGVAVKPGQVLLTVEAPALAVLGAERTALNFASHLSGIATETRRMVDLVSHTKAQICCTRKTTPGLRALEKYAVRAGGGKNHRYRLDDGILIKDNHIAVAGGIRPAVEKALAARGHMVRVEVEVDTPAQLKEILDLPVDAVLLDNMSLPDLAACVRLAKGRFLTEASGGVNAGNIKEIAETGVDLVSLGWLTHSAPALDIGLDIEI